MAHPAAEGQQAAVPEDAAGATSACCLEQTKACHRSVLRGRHNSQWGRCGCKRIIWVVGLQAFRLVQPVLHMYAPSWGGSESPCTCAQCPYHYEVSAWSVLPLPSISRLFGRYNRARGALKTCPCSLAHIFAGARAAAFNLAYFTCHPVEPAMHWQQAAVAQCRAPYESCHQREQALQRYQLPPPACASTVR